MHAALHVLQQQPHVTEICTPLGLLHLDQPDNKLLVSSQSDLCIKAKQFDRMSRVPAEGQCLLRVTSVAAVRQLFRVTVTALDMPGGRAMTRQSR